MSNRNRKGTGLQVSQDERGIQLRTEHIEEYSPYPSGEFLQQLQQIDPTLVNRVMIMAETEQQHRHQLQNAELQETIRVNTANISNDNKLLGLLSKGQIFGLISTVLLLLIAGMAIIYKESWVAVTAIGAIIGTLIVYVLRQQPKPPPPQNP